MCNKIKHKTTYGASKHADALRSNKKLKNKQIGIYWCASCTEYHVTTHPGKGCIIV